MSPAAKNINQATKEWAERTAKLDSILALEQEQIRSLPAAKQVLTDARRDRVLAEAGSMRGLPDRRAEAATAEQTAVQALEDLERRINAAHEAVQAERIERGRFSAEHRGELHANALAGNGRVTDAACEAIDKVKALQEIATQAAEAWTPLRPVRRDLGVPIGREAHAPSDLQAIVAALTVVAERGMTAPSDVDATDGSPVTSESRAAERIRTTTKVDEAMAPLMERL